MALARWIPAANLHSFQEEMNRLFHEFFRGGNGGEQGWAPGPRPSTSTRPMTPWC